MTRQASKAGPRTALRNRPEENRAGGRAEAMMAAALALFAERDYADVTMQDIAARCGVKHSLIYYYFKNKRELLDASIEHFILELVTHYEAVARKHHADPVAQLDGWFDANVALAANLRRLVKVMFDYAGPRGRSVSVDAAIAEFYRLERETIASAIREGGRRGVFAPVDPDRLTSFVSTQIDGIFFGSMMRSDVDLAAKMNDLRHFLWRLLDYDSAAKAGRRDSRKGRRGAV